MKNDQVDSKLATEQNQPTAFKKIELRRETLRALRVRSEIRTGGCMKHSGCSGTMP